MCVHNHMLHDRSYPSYRILTSPYLLGQDMRHLTRAFDKHARMVNVHNGNQTFILATPFRMIILRRLG